LVPLRRLVAMSPKHQVSLEPSICRCGIRGTPGLMAAPSPTYFAAAGDPLKNILQIL